MFWQLLRMEFLLEMRQVKQCLYPISFFCIVLLLFPLALTPDPLLLQKLMPGCIWIACLLASLLSVNIIFLNEFEEGYIEQLLISPCSLSLIILIKMIVHWIVSMLPLICIAFFAGFFSQLSLTQTMMVVLTLLIGSPILTCVSIFAVALTLGLKQQAVLLCLLILPLLVPVLIFGVNIVEQYAAHFIVLGPVLFLSGLAVLTVVVMPHVTAAVIRLQLSA